MKLPNSPVNTEPKPSASGFGEEEEEEGVDVRYIPKRDARNEQLRRGSSYRRRKGNALASGADEGRDKLR